MSFAISNCVLNIPTKFGNRQDLANLYDGFKPVTALQQAIQALTETYEFEELKFVTPQPPLTPLAMTTGQPLVPIPSLLATIVTQAALYPQFQGQNFLDITDVYAFWIWFAGPAGTSGSNQAGRLLDYRRVPAVDTYSYGITSNTQGILGTAPPVYFTRFGNNLQVGPAPNNPYSFFVRVKLRHPFPPSLSFTPAVLTAVLSGTAVASVTINYGGTGYPPSATVPVYFTRPGGGPLDAFSTGAATANATTNAAGVITSIAIVGGGSYPAGVPFAGTQSLSTQQIFMPDSWQEIVEYAACWKLALWEGAQEYIVMFEGQLRANGVDPNLLRRSQMERDEKHNTRALSLRTSKYTHA